MYKISEKEIEVMSHKPATDRYVYFIKKVADWESVWFLKDKDGIVLSSNNEGIESIPVWPFKEYALNCKTDEWKNCELEEMQLVDFMDEFLIQLIDDDIKLSVFMTNEDSNSTVIAAKKLLDDLQNECSKYE